MIVPLWQDAPSTLSLPTNTVHVWRTPLDLPHNTLYQLAATLTPDEQLRAERFRFERDRRRFVVGRGVLRHILSRYQLITPEQLQFNYNVYGKPILVETDNIQPIAFNLSHSHELAVYALTIHGIVGIDLEWLRVTNLEQIAKRFFSAREYTEISLLEGKQKQIRFFRYWTLKEAYLKAIGRGIGELEQVEIDLSLETQTAHLRLLEQTPMTNWFLYSFTPANGYIAAVAIEQAEGCPIVWYDFDLHSQASSVVY
jgi:4'-phosphopantetheinyl transferase